MAQERITARTVEVAMEMMAAPSRLSRAARRAHAAQALSGFTRPGTPPPRNAGGAHGAALTLTSRTRRRFE